jgi:putative ABC transport system permease protein
MTELWPVDEEYISTMGMKISKGRNFSAAFGTDSTAMVINETAARMLGFATDPLNRKLYKDEPGEGVPPKEFHVIGVLKDFNFTSLRDNITPVVLMLAENNGALSIRTDVKDVKSFIAKVESKWNAMAPNEHFEYSFMEEDFNTAYRTEQRTGNLFLSFTILACLIACLGLFSLAAYAAEQRQKEIGVRKVLGASVTNITAMLSKDFVRLVIIAIVIAIPLAWWAGQKWLQGFAYRDRFHWWIYALGAFAAILIALITVSFQSIKAALANPVNSLRSE